MTWDWLIITAMWVSGNASVEQAPSGARETLHPAWGPMNAIFWASFLIQYLFLGNRLHEERCCFPTDFNVQLQLQTLCIRCLFDSSKNKPLEHYTHNVLLALAVFFSQFMSYYKGQTITEWLLMVSHNTIVLSLTDPTVNSF